MKYFEVAQLNQILADSNYLILSSENSYKMFKNIFNLRKIAKTMDEMRDELIKKNNVNVGENGQINIEEENSKKFVEQYNAMLNDTITPDIEINKLKWNDFYAFVKESKFKAAQISFLSDIFLDESE